MPILHPWPRRQPTEDPQTTGITFVDVLFALVVGRVLEKATGPGVIAAGYTHLGVAGVLTLTSWIGYHSSANRPRYSIRFPNLPLAQFTLDIAMVVVYWLTAVTAEIAMTGHRPNPTAWKEAGLVAASFLLYVLWDGVGSLIRNDLRYPRDETEQVVAARRYVTIGCFAVAVLVLGSVLLLEPATALAVQVVDALLIALLLVYRFLKEYVTPGDATPSRA